MGKPDELWSALTVQDMKKAKRLIKKRSNINQVVGLSSQTLLILAASRGLIDTIDLLIEEGADLNLVDMYGDNAVICACRNGHNDVVLKLINNGAKVAANTLIELIKYQFPLALMERLLKKHSVDLNEEYSFFWNASVLRMAVAKRRYGQFVA
jgi:ankyrin repeat protein